MLTRRDYWAVGFIGACFGLFAIPISAPFVRMGWAVGVMLVIAFTLFAIVALMIAAFLSRWIPVLFQVAKFSAVGAFNTFLDWGVLSILIAFFGTVGGVGYAVAKGTSFTLSNIGSYFWNKYWTFDAGRATGVGKEVTTFIVVSVLGLVINIAISSMLVNAVQPPSFFTPQRWALAGAVVATLASLVWNFFGYKFVVFKPAEGQKGA